MTHACRKLPIGIQTFAKIREVEYLVSHFGIQYKLMIAVAPDVDFRRVSDNQGILGQ